MLWEVFLKGKTENRLKWIKEEKEKKKKEIFKGKEKKEIVFCVASLTLNPNNSLIVNVFDSYIKWVIIGKSRNYKFKKRFLFLKFFLVFFLLCLKLKAINYLFSFRTFMFCC